MSNQENHATALEDFHEFCKEQGENQMPYLKGFLEFCKEQGNEPINHSSWETCAIGKYSRTLGLSHEALRSFLSLYLIPVETHAGIQWEYLDEMLDYPTLMGSDILTYPALVSLLEKAKPEGSL